MIKRKIVILTLTGQRDLIVDRMIADKLRQYGHEVHVHNYINAGRQSIPYIKPDIVVHPFPGGEFKIDFIKKCKEWGCGVVIRRGEAGASRESFIKMTKDVQTVLLSNWDYSPYIDLDLFWGNEFRQLVAERGYTPLNKSKVCGAFAFDAYFLPEFQRVRNHQKTILFATGWSCAEEKKINYCECGLERHIEYQRLTFERHRRGRDLWIETITQLWHKIGHEWKFTLKVRPGEQIDEYIDKLGDFVQVYPQMYPAVDALKVADLLIHTGSTMAIEAHLLNMPSINFYNANPDPMLSKVSPMVNTYEELETAIQDIDVNKSNINRFVYSLLKDHLYGDIDGKACERAANYIHEFAQTNIKTSIPDTWPQEPLYWKDKKNISLEIKKPFIHWTCPCCKNDYWVNPKFTYSDCPYCGMVIEISLEKKKTVSVLK